MSKCLRCGAGNEWIEPVAKEAKKPRRKRPKVRYVATSRGIYSKERLGMELDGSCGFYVASPKTMRRVAAALNLYEAVRRGEL